MTLKYIFLCVIACASAEIIDLSCQDDAACIDNLTRELVKGIRQRKTVRLFDTLTIEPVGSVRQARSNQGALAKFLSTHAVSFDWDDYSFKFTKPATRSGVIEMDVFQGRAVEEEGAETATKKASSSEDKDEPKPKRRIIRRRHSKRIMQAILPMMVGMKSASTVILAISAVAALTMKAFLASKLALLVTVSMAAKKLYESFGQGVGLQNHPYLYSQYPIDFPSATSHAYSVSGMQNPQFPTSELYSPTALASHTHHHEILQQGDNSAQQSAPALQLANSTRASERWDGKSKLLNMVKPIVDTVKSVLQPIAGGIVNVMPESFRAITSKAFGLAQNDELEDFIESRVPKGLEIEADKPKLILVPKPRQIERNMIIRADAKVGPKKVRTKIIDINNLRVNKDLNDYTKTKKYNYNYHNTHYYPKVKYFAVQEKLYPHKSQIDDTFTPKIEYFQETDAKPYPEMDFLNDIYSKPENNENVTTRRKRDIMSNKFSTSLNNNNEYSEKDVKPRGFSDFLFNSNPVNDMIKRYDDYVKTFKKKPLKHPVGVTSQKIYYVGIEMIKFGLQMFDVYVDMADSILKHLVGKKIKKGKIGHGYKPVLKPLKPVVKPYTTKPNPLTKPTQKHAFNPSHESTDKPSYKSVYKQKGNKKSVRHTASKKH